MIYFVFLVSLVSRDSLAMKLLRSLFLLAIFLFLSGIIHAQGAGINTTGDAPAAGSILDVSAIDKAVLLPRTTTESIANPIEGMVIYDTTAHQFHYFNGLQWCALLEEGAYNFYWADEDGDGYGYPFNVIYSPDPPEFFVDNNDDCDDTDPDVNPAGVEICDGKDNDCNGLIDFDDPGLVGGETFWFDSDGDGYGDPAIEIMECFAPEGYVDNSLDCDDTNPNAYTGAEEVCDYIDNNCNGEVDEGFDLDVDLNNCGFCGNVCNDGIDCTIDYCSAGVCFYDIDPTKCLIDGICYDDGELNPESPCQICDALNPTTWTNLPAGTNCPLGTCNEEGMCILD